MSMDFRRNRRPGRFMRLLPLVAAAGIAAGLVRAQSPHAVNPNPSSYESPLAADRGIPALWQSLKKLQTRASLLMITAHPDDEDGGMLAYQSRGKGARVALLTLNRGEGGANVMSPDYFDALGLVRTMELLEADRYYGVQQYFTRAIDYGFSKSKEEALSKWNHDRVLADAVRVVRVTRPLVVTSVFIGGPTDGHGNHQTAGQLAQEVFLLAGDPAAFPEQIAEGLKPWSPLKTYGRVPFSLQEGSVSLQGLYDYANHKWSPAGAFNYVEKKWFPGALPATLEVPVGQYDPMLGATYAQFAREGLGYQMSQNGGGSIPAAGELASAYHRFGSKIPGGAREGSFFDGIDISLMGIADLAGEAAPPFLKEGLSKISTRVEEALRTFSPAEPSKTAPPLAGGLKETNALVERVISSSLSEAAKYDITHELRVKQVQFNSAILQALGISLRAAVAPEKPPSGPFAAFMGTPESFQIAVPGQTFYVGIEVNNPSPIPLQIEGVSLAGVGSDAWIFRKEGNEPGTLIDNNPVSVRFKVIVPRNAPFTRPYFSRPDIEQAYYDIQDERYLTMPIPPYALSARVGFLYEGLPLHISQAVQSVKRTAGLGTRFQPLMIGPSISVSISPRAGIVPLQAKSFTVTGSIRSNVKGPAQGKVRLQVPEGWSVKPSPAEFATANDGEERSVTFEVFPRDLREKSYSLTAVAEYGGLEFREGFVAVGYSGLRPYNLYRPSTYRTSGVDVRVAPGIRVGYVTGSGDDVPKSLENLGVRVTFLSAQDLTAGDLSKYDVILLGVRTYAVREDLKTNNGRILDYVKNGGTVVVQYNTPEYDNNYGPYPYVMSRDPEEVTDEASEVRILEPGHPVFNWPNKITARDFDGWVEERGSKFLQSWDKGYQALLETHDAGQDPQRGGLVYAKFGKGIYVYCAYAFYRQLPEGVPGAYRLFANLISLPANPGR